MSTVVLHSIAWNNCFSFGQDNFIDLSSEPLTQIIAPNGYGKSSIPLILEEATYNKNSKGVKKADIANRMLDSNYDISVSMSVDSDMYEINVVRKGASVKVKLLCNSVDISSHTATNTFKQIEDLIGIDFKTFQQLVYQSTNSSLAFLTATDTARKKFLIDLFDLSEYTKLFEVFKSASKDLNSETDTLEGRVSTIARWMEANSSLTLDLAEVLEIPDRPDLSYEMADLSSKISNVEKINSNITKNNSLKKRLEQIDIEELRSSDLQEESYDEYQHEIGVLQSKKNSAEATINKLKGLEDKCPTCLQDIDKDFYDNLLVDSTTESAYAIGKIKLLTAEVERIKAKNRLISSIKSQISEYEALEQQVDRNLQSTFLDATDLLSELNSMKDRLAEADSEIARLTRANNEAIKQNSKIEMYLEQNEEFSKQLVEAREQLGALVGRLKGLEVLKKAFSTNGLIAYKLENLVKDLETFTNEYLAELSDGRFTIEFSIVSDKLNVIVTDEGKEISITAPSSGELARINISTLLAIRKLMSSISKNTINVLFLDEVISVLDDYGREQLVEVLLKEEGLNTFLVSHSWTHPLVDKLLIKKNDGISWIDRG